MARPPASAPAPPPWPDSRHAPRRGEDGGVPPPSHPAPRPATTPHHPPSPPNAPPLPDVAGSPPHPPTPEAWLPPPSSSSPHPLPDAWVPFGDPPPGDPDTPPAPPGFGGGSRRVLFADALGLPLARLRQYPPWDPRGRGGPPPGEGGGGGGQEGTPQGGGEGGAGGEQPPGSWMRPGKGRPQEAEDTQPPPPDHEADPDPSPKPLPETEQPLAQGAEEEAVARELEQLYLSHLRRLRGGDPGDFGDPPAKNEAGGVEGGLFPERAPNTSLANEMALLYEGGGGGGRSSPPALLGRGGPVEGALVVPARPPPGRGGALGGALRGCGVLLALAVLVPVAWGDGGGPTAALALGLYLALAWLT